MSANIAGELAAILDNARRTVSHPKVLLIGDTPWDVFWLCRRAEGHQTHTLVEEIQYDVEDEVRRPGTVFAPACFLKELGWHVTVLTLLGTDELADLIRNRYEQADIELIPIRKEGASFQRHYVVQPVTGVNAEVTTYESVQRVNHEPKLGRQDFLDSKWPSEWRDRLVECYKTSTYILIDDTHKGTLSWCPHTDAVRDALGSPVLWVLKETVARDAKPITVLDVRKCLHLYSDVSVEFLASSAHEVAYALGLEVPDHDIQTGGYLLGLDDARRLLDEFPKIREWALTCGPNGSQHGKRSQSGWSLDLFDYNSLVVPASATGFTPHCGDLFDAGLLVGLAYGADIVDAPLHTGRYAASLQAVQSNCRRLRGDDLLASRPRSTVSRRLWAYTRLQRIERRRYERAGNVVAELAERPMFVVRDYLRTELLPCWSDSPLTHAFEEASSRLRSSKGSGVLVLCLGVQGAGKTPFMKALTAEQWADRGVSALAAVDLRTPEARDNALSDAVKRDVPVVVDELQAVDGDWFLPFVDTARYDDKHRALGLSGPVDIIAGGAALTEQALSRSPWKDICQRAKENGAISTVPGYDESPEEIPLWFALAVCWEFSKRNLVVRTLRLTPAVLGNLMLLPYDGTARAWDNTQNWYLIAKIAAELLDKGIVVVRGSEGILDSAGFGKWLRCSGYPAVEFKAGDSPLTLDLPILPL